MQVTFGEVSEEILKQAPEETLQYCRVAFGFLEPEEKNSSDLSWSNSTTSDSIVDPRNLTSACATIFSSVEITSLAEVPSFVSSKN